MRQVRWQRGRQIQFFPRVLPALFCSGWARAAPGQPKRKYSPSSTVQGPAPDGNESRGGKTTEGIKIVLPGRDRVCLNKSELSLRVGWVAPKARNSPQLYLEHSCR